MRKDGDAREARDGTFVTKRSGEKEEPRKEGKPLFSAKFGEGRKACFANTLLSEKTALPSRNKKPEVSGFFWSFSSPWKKRTFLITIRKKRSADALL